MLGTEDSIPISFFPAETVVFDENGKVLVKCATEEEAVEYTIDLRSEVEDGI